MTLIEIILAVVVVCLVIIVFMLRRRVMRIHRYLVRKKDQDMIEELHEVEKAIQNLFKNNPKENAPKKRSTKKK